MMRTTLQGKSITYNGGEFLDQTAFCHLFRNMYCTEFTIILWDYHQVDYMTALIKFSSSSSLYMRNLRIVSPLSVKHESHLVWNFDHFAQACAQICEINVQTISIAVQVGGDFKFFKEKLFYALSKNCLKVQAQAISIRLQKTFGENNICEISSGVKGFAEATISKKVLQKHVETYVTKMTAPTVVTLPKKIKQVKLIWEIQDSLWFPAPKSKSSSFQTPDRQELKK